MLFAGAMAEAQSAAEVGGDYVEGHCFKLGGGARDASKINELIAIHLNISEPDQMSPIEILASRNRLYKSLRQQGKRLVRDEFDLIDALAEDHVANLSPVTRGWSWALRKQDVDALPRLAARFP